MISREILDQEGQFGAPRSTPLDFTPKAIYYEEVTNTLLFIPEEPGINITLVNINPTRVHLDPTSKSSNQQVLKQLKEWLFPQIQIIFIIARETRY
ncbi:hypothetical protein QWY93_18930 [Echinicola jeungdonensis]|uniref:hypothetical protein n=1 Tax=Echinicola jeungdonensis TaxID=709343 RepID=UPI0025B5CEC6|nr:hypothetical protein [Echinicola jeungdonensis]MDN3671345.1 hypothetical protein [Echinicola jeungdonensis]